MTLVVAWLVARSLATRQPCTAWLPTPNPRLNLLHLREMTMDDLIDFYIRMASKYERTVARSS